MGQLQGNSPLTGEKGSVGFGPNFGKCQNQNKINIKLESAGLVSELEPEADVAELVLPACSKPFICPSIL